MRKPSLEEVREYFKDAKIVKNVISTFEIEDTNDIIEGVVVDTDYFYRNKLGIKKAVWESHVGYAQILEYKTNKKPMKKVIRLDEPKEEKKPIELTHYHSSIGWEDSSYSIYRIVKKSEKIIYLGRCDKDKDMFAVYTKDGFITICRGHLNDGVY